MKKIFLSLFSIIFTVALFATDLTDAQVPQAVKNAVTKKFSQAKNIDWEMKGVYYQAEFKIDRREHEILLDDKGRIVKMYEDISFDELPAKAKQSIKAQYASHKVSDVERITKDSSVLFKVELEHGDHDVDLYFDKDGNIVEMPMN